MNDFWTNMALNFLAFSILLAYAVWIYSEVLK